MRRIILPQKAASFALLLTLHILFAASSYAQIITDKRGQLSRSETANHLAFQQIKLLKDGVLLVRLQTRSVATKTLRAEGNEDAALRIEQQQKERNLAITSAFQSEWDFCPVYFFYAEQSTAVTSRDWANVNLMTSDLKPATDAASGIKNFFIAEFARTQVQDDTPFELHFIDKDGIWQMEKYDNPGGSNNTFGALRIMNTQLQQLHAPFPFKVRTFEDVFWRRKPSRVVRMMNKKMHGFAEFK